MIHTCYNTYKFLKNYRYFHTHLFCIDGHADGMPEVSKKHYQNLEENDFLHQKTQSEGYIAGIHQENWYVVGIRLFWYANDV